MTQEQFDTLKEGSILIDKITWEEFYVCGSKRRRKNQIKDQIKVKSLNDGQHSRVSRDYCDKYYFILGEDKYAWSIGNRDILYIQALLKLAPNGRLKCLNFGSTSTTELIRIIERQFANIEITPLPVFTGISVDFSQTIDVKNLPEPDNIIEKAWSEYESLINDHTLTVKECFIKSVSNLINKIQ